MPKKKKSNTNITLESEARFSESLLWELQKSAYTQFGVDAWSKKGVPFYLTSNPYTAKQYAQVVIGYIRDCIKPNAVTPLDKSEPLYIFDLGAGTGRFGYLFLKQMMTYLAELRFDDIKICYVMTDIVKSNLDFCKGHPYLQPFVREGMIDFAYYHSEQKEPLELLLRKKTVTPEFLKNPIVVIGNYFFDTIHQDLFKTIQGNLHEGRITINVPEKDATEPLDGSNPELIKHIKCSYTYVPIETESYYSNKQLDRILQEYRHTFENVPFLFPVGAFHSIDYFANVSGNRMLLLAGDQGVCTDEQVKEWGEPRISKHGSFSISVSYHAIAKYFRNRGGAGLLTTQPDPLFVVLGAILGGNATSFYETYSAFKNCMDVFEASDYWKLINYAEQEWKTPSIEYILLLLKFGNWDPMNFHAFFPVIRSQIPGSSPQILERLAQTIENVWGNFYPVSKEEGDFILNLGVLLFEMKKVKEALVYFERSLAIAGGRKDIYQNIFACYMTLGDYKKAKEYKDSLENR